MLCRRIGSPRLRVALFVVLLAATVFMMTVSSSWAADSAEPGAAGERKPTKPGVFSLIMSNRDPVFYVIMVCSIAGGTFIIQGFIRNRRSVLMPESSINQIREMITQRQFKELIEYTENDPTFVSRALNPALKRAPSFSSMKEAMETALGEQTAEQFRSIEYLNIIGNLGPLLGLLGTVLGMIDAFSEMSAHEGGANPTQLAGGISKALCHTLLGLSLAVPCLAAFGWLRTIVDRLTVAGALEAEELLLMIKPAEAKPAAVAAAATAPRPAGLPVPPPQPVIAANVAPPPRKAPVPAPPSAPAV